MRLSKKSKITTGDDLFDAYNYSESLGLIDVLIDGPYIDNLNDNKGIRGSSNQQIHILNERFQDRYLDAHNWERQSQIVESNYNLISVGIPMKMDASPLTEQ
ncbi:hypothetical protein FACS1894216_15320 [Synergistales bacterium]|nr:hypothetical protein FACS1894216_15320 [Synergistales bacterium]